ncbi:hypothetical protein CYMTET_13974 [Cymbomonas tetramitiformis]|uniref:L-ascorbate peroxidase n=1 Tax=Cymbomonas tetramitiformis TaxID=36881 RepID=A0AAE0GHK1_9CHLO|nr:hypothetical protein CYMTET_13974 [Cymbomonas tetramitiformis]
MKDVSGWCAQTSFGEVLLVMTRNIIFFGLLTSPNSAFALTCRQVEDIKADIRALIPNADGPYLEYGQEITPAQRARGDFIGGVVRLGWHDGSTYSQEDSNGGMDGCLNFDDPANKGLRGIWQELRPVYRNYEDVCSRADFTSLATITVIKAAGGPDIEIPYGRVDADECDEDWGRFPSLKKSRDHVRKVFRRMGFTMQEAVALMGAHTVGRCELKNFGLEGPWAENEHVFDNAYYHKMLDLVWERKVEVTEEFGSQPHWDHAKMLLMLNTDISLAWNIDGDNDDPNHGDPHKCGGDMQCDTQNSYRHVARYAQSQEEWFEDFSSAWIKLLSLGQDGDLQKCESEEDSDSYDDRSWFSSW